MIKPLRGYILVEQLDEELKTSSGIALPESTKDKPIKGIVLNFGETQCNCVPKGYVGTFMHKDTCDQLKKNDFKVGDKVIYKRWTTTDLEEDGKKLSFVAFQDVLGVYE